MGLPVVAPFPDLPLIKLFGKQRDLQADFLKIDKWK
jgi:hypothetical protein